MNNNFNKCCCDITECVCSPKNNWVVNDHSGGGQCQPCNTICVGSTGATGATGANGVEGLSAYEIAVENGFIGTYEEWITSLQGPTGTAPLYGGVIPYSSLTTEASFSAELDYFFQTIMFLGFQGINTDMQLDGGITVIDNDDEDLYIPCFVVQKDSTITGISFEINAEFSLSVEGIEFVGKVCIYTSPQNSSIFTQQQSTIVNLTPTISSSQYATIYGSMEFSLPVSVGTKIAFAVIIEPVNFPSDTPPYFVEMFGNSWGGINIKENV